MSDYSFIERIKTIFDMVSSSSFFIALFIILVLAALVLILNNKLKNKIAKYLILISYALIIILVIYKYSKYISNLNDSFVNKIFSLMYFPNIISYICMLIISILVIIRTFVKKDYDKVLKIGNILCFSGIEFLFVLVLEIVKDGNIDIYSISSVYANEKLLILLQASSGVFFVWMGILLFYYIVEKLAVKAENKNDISVRTTAKPVKINYKNIKDDIINNFSDEDFKTAYSGFKAKQTQIKYNEIFNNNKNN